MRFWLVKSEPHVYSFDDLLRSRSVWWDGVRNYQARNHLRAMRLNDRVIVYHSNADPPGAAGIAEVSAEHVPDPTQFDPASQYYDPRSSPHDPRWSWVELTAVAPIRFVPLHVLRSIPELTASALVAKGSRLSVIELTEVEFSAIITAGTSDHHSR